MKAYLCLRGVLYSEIKQITNIPNGIYKPPIITFLIFLCFVFAAKAQEVEVRSTPGAKAGTLSGIVVSAETNKPLEGATLKIKNTKIVSFANNTGEFSVAYGQKGGILEVSFMGYRTKEVSFSTSRNLVITLDRDLGMLEEVEINTGYQRIAKERATGSFSQPIKEIFDNRISTDVLSKLNGITNGLMFNSNTGNTIRGELDLNIRGRSTINANDQPLIVVDNFPYGGELININPNDVKSVTILKDAAAASIWGARAGNGVIVITTKRGRKSQPLEISVNSNITVFNKPNLFYNPVFLPADHYIGIEKFLFDQGKYDNDLKNNTSYPVISPAVEIMNNSALLNGKDSLRLINQLKGIDVRDQNRKYFYRKETLQQYALSLNGGTSKSTYYFSVGYDRNLERLKHNGSDRVSLNSSNSFQLSKNLSLLGGIYFTQRTEQRDNTLGSVTETGSTYYPYINYADAQGGALPITYLNRTSYLEASKKKGFLDWSFRPLDELGLTENRTRMTDIRLHADLNYNIWQGLNADIKYQYQRHNTQDRRYNSLESFSARSLINRFSIINGDKEVTGYNVPLGGYLENSYGTAVLHNFRAQLNFDKDWNDHHFNAIAGYELSESDYESQNATLFGYDDQLAINVPVNSIGYFNTNPSGNASIPQNGSISGTLDRFRSVYALGSYAYSNRYTLTGSARVDGSNYFGVNTNQKSVPLWSIGAKWNLANEKFYRSEFLPVLNLTASYGYSGNLDRSTTGITTFRYLIMARWTNLKYANLINIGNPDLMWERSRQTKIGVEFALKNQVLSGNIEFYFKRGTDLIGTTQLAPSTGVTNFNGNYSQMKGGGIDIVVNSRNTDGNLKWRTSLILNTAYDKITKYDIANANSQLLTADGLNGKSIVPIVGSPLYSVYSLAFSGLDPETGDPMGYLNGEKSKDYAKLNNSSLDELIFNGTARPRIFGGLINTFSFKNFSMAITLNYKLDYYFRRMSINYSSLLGNSIVPHMDFIKRWQMPGDEKITSVPSLVYPINTAREDFYKNSSVLIEKGDHIRLQDILFSYHIQGGEITPSPFKSVQVFTQFSNMGIIWRKNKEQLDPDYIPTRNNTFPIPFSFSIGIKAQL